MSDWNSIVGDFRELNSAKTQRLIISCLYQTILKQRENILTAKREDDSQFPDPHFRFLSLDEEKQLVNAKKDAKPEFKYAVEVPVTEEVVEDGKKKKKKVGVKPGEKKKGKWLTMSAELKFALMWWLKRFTKEIHNLYVHDSDECHTGFLPDDCSVFE